MRYTMKPQTGFLFSEEGEATGGGAEVTPSSTSTDNSSTEGDPSSVPSFDASGIFDLDGKFESIGDRYKSDDVSPEFINQYFTGKTPTEVAKILKDNQTAARAKSLSYPGADASEEEWGRFREAVLVPQEASQVMPENFEEFQNATGWTPEVAQPVVEAMIKAGTPGPAITAAMNAVQASAMAQGEAWQAQAKEAKEAAISELQDEYGGKYQDRINGAATAIEKAAIKAGLSEDRVADLKQGVLEMRNPDVTRAFAVVADEIQNAQYRGPGATSRAEEFRTAGDTASEIVNNPDHPMHARFHAGDREVNNYVDKLYRKEVESIRR